MFAGQNLFDFSERCARADAQHELARTVIDKASVTCHFQGCAAGGPAVEGLAAATAKLQGLAGGYSRRPCARATRQRRRDQAQAGPFPARSQPGPRQIFSLDGPLPSKAWQFGKSVLVAVDMHGAVFGTAVQGWHRLARIE